MSAGPTPKAMTLDLSSTPDIAFEIATRLDNGSLDNPVLWYLFSPVITSHQQQFWKQRLELVLCHPLQLRSDACWKRIYYTLLPKSGVTLGGLLGYLPSVLVWFEIGKNLTAFSARAIWNCIRSPDVLSYLVEHELVPVTEELVSSSLRSAVDSGQEGMVEPLLDLLERYDVYHGFYTSLLISGVSRTGLNTVKLLCDRAGDVDMIFLVWTASNKGRSDVILWLLTQAQLNRDQLIDLTRTAIERGQADVVSELLSRLQLTRAEFDGL